MEPCQLWPTSSWLAGRGCILFFMLWAKQTTTYDRMHRAAVACIHFVIKSSALASYMLMNARNGLMNILLGHVIFCLCRTYAFRQCYLRMILSLIRTFVSIYYVKGAWDCSCWILWFSLLNSLQCQECFSFTHVALQTNFLHVINMYYRSHGYHMPCYVTMNWGSSPGTIIMTWKF